MVFSHRPWLVAWLLVFAAPALAQAQAMTARRAWDAVVVGGLHFARPEFREGDNVRATWYRTGDVAAGVGWQWAPHLKAEIDFSATGQGRQYVATFVTVPNVSYPVPIHSERFTTTRAASASVIWQSADNEWVQPFVQAGVSVEQDRVRLQTHALRSYPGDPRVGGPGAVVGEDATGPPTTSVFGAALIGGGAKFYVSPRGFVRTDARLIVRPGAARVLFRAGVGIDF
jgi:opacity protein-like surface antigen